ncbi:MAG: s23 ribosomal protein [uncultured bacterium]|nr:MAG: s23 ribosomal protein [uncultured bacterium]
MSTKSLEKSIAWSKSFDLSLEIYKITRKFPPEERFGLISQMQRCAISVTSNIAEGMLRGSRGEFLFFLKVARGSAGELETQLMICEKLNYINKDTSKKLIDRTTEIIRILNTSIKTLKKNLKNPHLC